METTIEDCEYCETVLKDIVMEHLRKEHPKRVSEMVTKGMESRE